MCLQFSSKGSRRADKLNWGRLLNLRTDRLDKPAHKRNESCFCRPEGGSGGITSFTRSSSLSLAQLTKYMCKLPSLDSQLCQRVGALKLSLPTAWVTGTDHNSQVATLERHKVTDLIPKLKTKDSTTVIKNNRCFYRAVFKWLSKNQNQSNYSDQSQQQQTARRTNHNS